MSYKSNYYINSSSFLTATRVYIDEAMTILAPDGFYSSDIFVRQQVSGILLPFEYCDDCIASCGTSVDVQTDERGEFILDFDTSETGVVVVKFNPYQVPVGIKIEYNGSIYNTALSGRYGELSAGYELPLFLGSESSSCGIDPSPYTLDVYRFSNDDFVYANDYYLLTIQPESLSLTEHTPGTCAIIIPKSSATPESVRVIVYTICDNSEFDLEIDCTPIVDFSGSEVQVSSDDACTAETPNTYYKISMTVDDDMDINIDDFVFSDSLATTLLVEGFYGYSFYGGASGWFEVNEYGMVVDKGVCMTEINNGLLYNWFATTDERGLFAEGWRLSTREENIALGMAIGGPYNEIEEGQIYEFLMAGGEMKSTNIDDWNDPNTGASNSVGFNGKGSGIRESDGNFTNIKNYLICYYHTPNSFLDKSSLLTNSFGSALANVA